jgi:adenylate cyclase
MRIGVRVTIAGLVLSAIIVSTACVHVIWWRTAERTSRDLAATINQQIVLSVTEQLSAITNEARAAFTTVRTLFLQNVLETTEADKREFVFLSQMQAQPTVSWVAFGWPNGAFFGAHKLGDTRLEMIEIAEIEQAVKQRTDRYAVVTGDIEFEDRSFVDTHFSVLDQAWYRHGMHADDPRWHEVDNHPTGARPSIAYAGPIDVYQQRQGVLAVIIENTRLSRLLSRLRVGKTGAAFIFDRSGILVATPDGDADEVNPPSAAQPLLPVARAAIHQAGNAGGMGEPRSIHLTLDALAYDVTLTPLSFFGWNLAVVIPEDEILGPVNATIKQLAVGIFGVIALAALASAWLSQRVIAAPLISVGNELKTIQRFELDRVVYHPSTVIEIDDLSRAITDMAGGLSAFRKYIPADLVKTLITEGIAAEPGVALRPMTVMFVDLAGFTAISERMGDRVLPILSDYLNRVSACVAEHHGTIDKFIGDAVMAFWGAPTSNPSHAIDACRCALAIERAMRDLALQDDEGNPLHVRIGINSGAMLVGNIGSEFRLNYTVIGDAVNVASRLEAANKSYGTTVLIGEATSKLVEGALAVREVDKIRVRGRAAALRVFELLGNGCYDVRRDLTAPERSAYRGSGATR